MAWCIKNLDERRDSSVQATPLESTWYKCELDSRLLNRREHRHPIYSESLDAQPIQ